MIHTLKTVYAPVLTPFTATGACNIAGFLDHCRWIASQDAGLAVFGTNSEAASLSLREKLQMLDAIADAGIDPAGLLPGTGGCALEEAVELTRAAVAVGARSVLVLPPFFFKPASEDGLVAWYAQLIERVACNDLAVVLYNIPQFTGVPITPLLIARLRQLFPDQVVGVKDSSGDRASLEAYLAIGAGFQVFPASEIFLSETHQRGAVGCISATANVNARAMVDAMAQGTAEAFAQVIALRRILQAYPMIQAMKACLARWLDSPDWRIVRPPLKSLPSATEDEVLAALLAMGFAPHQMDCLT